MASFIDSVENLTLDKQLNKYKNVKRGMDDTLLVSAKTIIEILCVTPKILAMLILYLEFREE